MGRIEGEAEKVRRFAAFDYAARSWKRQRRVVARVETSAQGTDSRLIVTNLTGSPKTLYEKVYCARGRAENLIKAYKLHLASPHVLHQGDRRPVPAAGPHRRLWLMHTLRDLAPTTSFWRDAQFDTICLVLIKVAGRATEIVTRIKLSLPSGFVYRDNLVMLTARAVKLPP